MTAPIPRRDLLLIASDWQSRALMVAELQEAGYEVMAIPGLRYAERALASTRVQPFLIVLDVYADDDATPERVGRLAKFVPEAPFVLVVSALHQPLWEPLRPRPAALLHRPVTIGEIVATVTRLLPPPT